MARHWRLREGGGQKEVAMTPVLEALHAEHRNITRLLDALDHQIAILSRAAVPDYETVQAIADYFCDYPDRCHHPKENAVFERLKARFPEEVATIGDLAHEHRDVGARARRFRDNIQSLYRDAVISRDAVVSAARGFVEAERQHMRMEEERFFPLARRKLEEGDWAAIEERLSKEHDPLFGERVEQDYAALRERLLAWEKEYRPA